MLIQKDYQSTRARARFRLKRIGTLLLLGLLLGAIASATPIEHVVIVSWDGARPDCVLIANTPTLKKMAAEGAYTWWAQTVKPSVTLVAHTSMLTACQPARHKCKVNEWKPEDGFVRVPTCFELAKQAGGSTAMFVGKGKLRYLAKPETVDHYASIQDPPAELARVAAEYFNAAQPTLMFVHFNAPDDAGHSHFWGTPKYLESLEACDAALDILRGAVVKSAAASNTLVIVTADHGGHGGDHGSTDVRDMTIPWVAWSSAHIKQGEIARPVSVCDTAATAVWALGIKPPAQWNGHPLVEIFLDQRAFKPANKR